MIHTANKIISVELSENPKKKLCEEKQQLNVNSSICKLKNKN